MSDTLSHRNPAGDLPLRVEYSVLIRLCIMMFLQFFIWGAWYVTTSNFMKAQGIDGWIGWAYSVGPLAAIISPFFLGMVADRFFASERVLCALHLLGAATMFLVPMAVSAGPTPFILLLLLHMLCYMPTLGLTNTLAFHNLTNRETQFPIIRVFGTLGWIAANLTVSFILKADSTAGQYFLTAGAAVALGLFSLALPHTPPPAAGRAVTAREILGLDALRLLRGRSFLIFAIASFLICIPLATYYSFANIFVEATGVERVAATMSVGQAAEVVFMLLMPFFFVRLGVKWMLAVGMAAWVLRYALFAAAAPSSIFWMILIGIALHGICYDFFFVTGFIYTDKKAAREIRGQAQGFLVLITQGLGMLIGAQIAGALFNNIITGSGQELMKDWQQFWLIPCFAAAAVMVFFIIFFRDDSEEPVVEPRGFEVAVGEAQAKADAAP